jgi:UDP:flavonoid glycosyltransferase YjiC (YdhE family)
MRITIIAGGTRGDVQPLAAVAKKLDGLGHYVRFAAHPSFSFLTEGTDIEFFRLEGNDPRDVHPHYIKDRPQNYLGKIENIRRVAHDYGDKTPLREACETTDFIFFSMMCWPAAHIAEQLKVPCAVAYLGPHFPTREFPRPFGPLFFHRHNFGPAWNHLTHWLMNRMHNSTDDGWLNPWRQEELGLPPLTISLNEWAEQRRILRLYGFSPSILPKPQDWPDWHHVTGNWFDEHPVTWQPPKELTDFLSAGAPPVFIGFSGSVIEDQNFWSETVVPAVRQAGCRAVIGAGWSAVEIKESDELFLLESCPFDWLFPKVSAVVHPCGASTMAEVLRGGVPSVCIPMLGEQRFFAARLERLGLAPSPLSPKRLTADRLARAIKQALNDDKIKSQARQVGENIRAEDGVGRAAELIEETAYQYSRH